MTECSRCGDCCEDIFTSWNLDYLKSSAERWLSSPDPAVDLVGFFEHMSALPAWKDAGLEEMLSLRRSTIANYEFVRDNWVSQYTEKPEDGHDKWTCTKFDPVARLCTAHDDRPPVCSGYPWYGKGPKKGAFLEPRCSFQADIKTMLPIVEVR